MSNGLLLFVQNADALSGNGGWFGAGLLGLVLGWLLFRHLPAKDAQIERIIAQHSASLERVIEKHNVSLEKVIAHCKEEMIRTSESLTRDLEQINAAAERNTSALEDLTTWLRDNRRRPPRGTQGGGQQ